MYDRRSLYGTLAQFCEKYALARQDVLLVGGGASLHHQLREKTEDIDLFIQTNDFNRLVKDYDLEVTTLPACGRLPSTRQITIKAITLIEVPHIDLKHARNHRGFKVMSLFDLYRYRIALGRSKDVSDIILLNRFKSRLTSSDRKIIETMLENVECVSLT